jgi:hypothetical protein
MPIDPGLIVPGPQIKTPLDIAVQGAQLQALTATAEQRQMETAQLQRQYDQESVINQAARDSQVPDPGNPGQMMTDHKAMLAKLSASAYPTLAAKYEQIFQGQSLDAQMKQMEFKNNIYHGAVDEPSYQQNMDTLANAGYADPRKLGMPDFQTAVKSGFLAKAQRATLSQKQDVEKQIAESNIYKTYGETQAIGRNAGAIRPGTYNFGQGGSVGQPPGQPINQPVPQGQSGRQPQSIPQPAAQPSRAPQSMPLAQGASPQGVETKTLPNGLSPSAIVDTPFGKMQAAQLWKMNPADLIDGLPKDQRAEAGKELDLSQRVTKVAPKILGAFRDSYDNQKHGFIGSVASALVPNYKNADMQAFDNLTGTTIQPIENSVRAGLFQSMHDNASPQPLKDLVETNSKETKDRNLQNYAMQAGDSMLLRGLKIDPNWFQATNVKAALNSVPKEPYQAQKRAFAESPEGTVLKKNDGSEVIRKGGAWLAKP